MFVPPPQTAPGPGPAPSWWSDLRHDLLFGARTLRRSPGFFLATAGTLALGLGGATAIFSLVSAILINPLANDGGDRLMVLTQSIPESGGHGLGFSVPELEDYRTQLESVEAVVEHHTMTFNLLGQGEPREVTTGVVDDRYFDAMGLRPALGRFFTAEENAVVGNAVLVLSHRYWQTTLGGDPGVIGRVFVMNGQSHTVIGVLPPITQFPLGNDIYVPTSQCPVRSLDRFKQNRGARMMTALVRLTPGTTPAAFRAELDIAASRIGRTHPELYAGSGGYRVTATPLKNAVIGDARRPLLLLAGATLMVLLVATSNVTGLQMARLTERQQELAVRTALGAGFGRLARQLAAESSLLALAGGGAGLLLAYQVMEPLKAFAARFTPRAAEAGIGIGVIGFGVCLAVVSGVVIGLIAALSVRRRSLSSLRSGGSSHDGARQRMLMASLVLQLAFAFVMLVGAGLLLRSLWLVSSVDPGFALDRVVTMRVAVPVGSELRTPQAQRNLWLPLLDQLRARPGITEVAVGSSLPLGPAAGMQRPFVVRGAEEPAAGRPLAEVRIVTPGYFRALGIPLRKGRQFDDTDQPATEQVAIVNEAFVRRYLSSRPPVGSVLIPCDAANQCPATDAVTIVGVVGDVSQGGLDVAPPPAVYGPALQSSAFGANLIIRTTADPAGVVKTATNLIRAASLELPIEDVTTMAAVRQASLAPRRLLALLMTLFAGLAVAVSGAGVMAMTAFIVSQRRREIGIRLALGAGPRRVVARMTGFTLRATALGLAIGGAGSVLATRSLAGLVWGVGTADGLTYLTAAGLLAALAWAAAWRAARHAGRVDPVTLIRAG